MCSYWFLPLPENLVVTFTENYPMSTTRKLLISLLIVAVAAVTATFITGGYETGKKSLPQRFITILAAGAVLAVWQIKKPLKRQTEQNESKK